MRLCGRFGRMYVIATYIGIALAVGLGLAVLAMVIRLISGRKIDPKTAAARFASEQAALQKSFEAHAAESSPRGLKLKQCEFDDNVIFARDSSDGSLRAFAGVTISFEAIEGGEMEDNPNVGNLRAATAVFHYQRGEWKADGKILFNLEPAEAIERFSHEELSVG